MRDILYLNHILYMAQDCDEETIFTTYINTISVYIYYVNLLLGQIMVTTVYNIIFNGVS